MKVLLIGARGFLGRTIHAELNNSGVEVLLPPPGDLTALSVADLLRCAEAADVVVNAAGRVSGSLSELVSANVTLPARLIGAATASGVRLIHLGSAAEYGQSAPGRAASEMDLCAPQAAYGVTKLAGTQLLVQATVAGQMSGTVLRVFNPLGAGMNAGSLPGRAARELREAALNSLPEVKFGSLGQQRDFLDARDVGRAVLHAVQHPMPALVNLGRGEALSSRELVARLVRLSGYKGRISEDGAGSGRSQGVPFQQANVLLLHACGFRPRYTVQDALESLWNESAFHGDLAPLVPPHLTLIS